MLVGQTKPLEIAQRVLSEQTLRLVMTPSFNVTGWKILDRWAMNSPAALKALEQAGEVPFLSRLLDQQRIEHEILTLPESLEAKQLGLMEHEILAQHQIETELH